MSLSLKQKPKVLCFVGTDRMHVSSNEKLPTESKLEIVDTQDQYYAEQLFEQINDDGDQDYEGTPSEAAKDDEEMVSVTKVLQGLRAKANIRKYNMSIESVSSVLEMCNNNNQYQHQHQHKEEQNDATQQIVPDYQYQQQRQTNSTIITIANRPSTRVIPQENTHATISNNSSSNLSILNAQSQFKYNPTASTTNTIGNSSATMPTEESRFSKVATADYITNTQFQQPLSRMPLSDISTAVSQHTMNKSNTQNNNNKNTFYMSSHQESNMLSLDQQQQYNQRSDNSQQIQGSFSVKEADRNRDHQYSSNNSSNSVYFRERFDNTCRRQETDGDTSSIPSESDQIASYEAYSYRRESRDIIHNSYGNNGCQKQLSQQGENIQKTNTFTAAATAAVSVAAAPLTSPTNKSHNIKGIALANSQQRQKQTTPKYPTTTSTTQLAQQRKNSNQRNTQSSSVQTQMLNTSATRSSYRTEKSPCTSDRFSKLLAKIQSKDNTNQEAVAVATTTSQAAGIDTPSYSPLNYLSQQETLPNPLNNGQQQQQYPSQSSKANRSGLLYHHQQQSIKHSKAVTQNIAQISQHLIDLQKNNKTSNNFNSNSSNSLSPYHSSYPMKTALNSNYNYQNNTNYANTTPTNARTQNNNIPAGKENINDSNHIKEEGLLQRQAQQLKSGQPTASTTKILTAPNGVRLSLADIENFSVNTTPTMSNSLRSAAAGGVDKCIHPSISPSCVGRNSHQLSRTNNNSIKSNTQTTLVKTISNDQLPRQPDIIKLSKPSTLHLRNHTESSHNSNSSNIINYNSNKNSNSSQHFGSNLKMILKASSTKNSTNSSHSITAISSTSNSNNHNNNSNYDLKLKSTSSMMSQHTLPSGSSQSLSSQIPPYVSITK